MCCLWGAGVFGPAPTFPIDREYVAEQLDFPSVTRNSLDSVSDRDFALEFLAASSILMMHLSRFSEELILWSTSAFRFVELSDGFCTGSSIMPQKKNPDVPELVRGKTGRVYGNLMALLTVMKALPLAYNKEYAGRQGAAVRYHRYGQGEPEDSLPTWSERCGSMLASMSTAAGQGFSYCHGCGRLSGAQRSAVSGCP